MKKTLNIHPDALYDSEYIDCLLETEDYKTPELALKGDYKHEKGVTVVLNPAPAAKLPKDLYRRLDWITPNETEAELLTGVKVEDAAGAARAVSVLRRRGVKHVLVTMGSKGVFCGDCGKLFPCRRVRAVDCVAAGDTFNGAFVVAISEGRTMPEAIDFAQKAPPFP